MPLTMYQASVPIFQHVLGQMRHVLEKAQAHADSKKVKPDVFSQMRLIVDMLPLVNQVQIATDVVKFCAARLAGQEAPKYEDNESTIGELMARIDKTIAYLKGFSAAQIDGTEGKAITIPRRSGDTTLNGQDYLTKYVLPNLYFHSTTTYNILRHNGVDIGKRDYLGF